MPLSDKPREVSRDQHLPDLGPKRHTRISIPCRSLQVSSAGHRSPENNWSSPAICSPAKVYLNRLSVKEV